MENVFMDTNPNDFVVLCHSEKPCLLAVRKENSAAKITRYGKDMRRRGVGYVSLHALHMNKTDSLLQHIPDVISIVLGEGESDMKYTVTDLIATSAETLDVDISKISSCLCKSIEECEKRCPRYHGCNTIAVANDMLVEMETAANS